MEELRQNYVITSEQSQIYTRINARIMPELTSELLRTHPTVYYLYFTTVPTTSPPTTATIALRMQWSCQGAFFNNGQTCCAAKRIYVQDRAMKHLPSCLFPLRPFLGVPILFWKGFF